MLFSTIRRRAKREDTGAAPRRSKNLAMLLLGGIVLVSQLLSPLQANAASIYDNAISVTNSLVITNGGTSLDITNNYAGYMLDTLPTVTTTCRDEDGHNIADDFANAKNWVVVQSYNSNTSDKIVILSYTKVETPPPLTFSNFAGGVLQYLQFPIPEFDDGFFMYLSLDSNGDVRRTCHSFSSSIQYYTALHNTSDNTYPVRPYVANYPITYPPDYEGEEVPDTAGPVSILRPNIVADVNNKHVAIMSKRSTDIIGDYKIYWFITNSTFDEEQPPIPFTLEGYSLPDQYLEFDIPTLNETISIQANFVDMNGDQLTPPVGYEFRPSVITLVPDGSIYSVDTDGMICNDNDSCSYASEEWEDEPCDLLNLGGCVANVWHYIQATLGIEKTRGNPTGSPFITFQTQTYGLTAVIGAPIAFIQSFTSTAACQPISVPLAIPYAPTNIQYSCMRPIYMQYFPDMFAIYQTIILGVIAYWICVRSLGLLLDAKRPHNDRIEVLDL